MAGDGVSLPTSIAQMGQVAKTQAKGQNQAQPVTPFNQQQDQQEEIRVKRVKETEATDHQRIDADEDRGDKRKRRRKRRQRKQTTRGETHEADGNTEDGSGSQVTEEAVGGLVDLHA